MRTYSAKQKEFIKDMYLKRELLRKGLVIQYGMLPIDEGLDSWLVYDNWPGWLDNLPVLFFIRLKPIRKSVYFLDHL